MREVFRLAGRITLEGAEYVGKKLDEIDQEARKLGRSLDSTGRAISKAGKNLTQWVSGPLLAVGAAVTKFGADFESAMTRSTAIMGDLSDEMRKKLSATAREVGTTTKFSASEAAAAYEFLASAGYDAERSIAALPKVAAFAQAANTDLSRATTLLADAQSALGLASLDATENMENMARVSDVLVLANTLANASTEQFSEALTNKAAAAMRLVNKDVEEGVAVLAALADQGVKGAAAGEQLNIVMRDLQKAAINNKEAFEQANISVYDANGNIRNLADVIGDLENRFDGMSDEQKRSEMMMLGFQDRSVSAMMTLMGTSDAIRDYEKALRDAGGTTDEIASKKLKDFWTQLDLLKKKLIDVALTLWEDLQPVLMDNLIPALEAGVEKLKALSQWFGNLDPSVKKTIIVLAGALAVLGPLLIVVGKVISAGKLLIPLFVMIKKEFILLNAVMKANPFLAVVTAVMALTMAATYLYQNWDKVSAWLAKTWGWIADVAQDVFSAVKIKILEFTRGAVEAISKVTQYIPGLGTVVEKAKESLDEMITTEHNKKAEKFAAKMEEAAKSTEKVAESAESLKKKTEELTTATQEQTEAIQTQVVATEELTEEQEKLTEERIKFETEWTKKLFEQTATRLQLLDAEEKEALAKAGELEAERTAIQAYYKAEREKLAEEEAQAKASFEEKWSDKVFEESATRLESLEAERKEALAEAEKLGADTASIETYYSIKRQEILDEEAKKAAEKAKEIKEARESFEAEWNKKYFEATADRMEILEAEMQDALTKAEDLGASEADIVAYYEQKKRELRQQTFNDYLSTAQDMLGRVGAIFSQSFTNREREIDNWYQNQKNTLDASLLDEEQKEAAIKELDEERDRRKREIARKQAVAEKASTLFSIAINTARAAIEALPNLVLSGIIAAMGAVQAGLVVAEPLPALKKGGWAVGETAVVVGDTPSRERGELILPMRTGVEVLAETLLNKLSQVTLPQPAFAMAGGSSTAYDNRRTEVHLHVGTLVADNLGLKKLERQLSQFRIDEERRRGG